jgi:transcriptional regulator with XRE-family HTH domain
MRKLYSLRALAVKAGVAPRTILEAEAGRQTPRPTTMRKLADALGVDPMEIDEFRTAVDEQVEASKDAA